MFFVQLLTSQQSEQLKNTFPNRADFSKFKSDGSAMALKGQQSANISPVPAVSHSIWNLVLASLHADDIKGKVVKYSFVKQEPGFLD